LRNRLSNTFDRSLSTEKQPDLSPIDRLRKFFEEFRIDISKSELKTGCGFGNISQEMAATNTNFRRKLEEVYSELTGQIRDCLRDAVKVGEINSDTHLEDLARFIFNSWEGALIFVKVLDDVTPLVLFERHIFDLLLPCLSA
ncbi:MAG: hypothetical protein GF388_01810, partial [Candidatus Aegiribacteria sp.]|nr:hypothetical protein [Candidatus Aegiribacteria sp.]